MKYHWSKYNYIFFRKESVLLYNTLTNALNSISKEEFINARMVDKVANKNDLDKWQTEGKFFVEDDLEERKKFINGRQGGRGLNLLDIYLYPTLKCNFSCQYCYQKEFSKTSMSISVIEQIEQFIVNKLSKENLPLVVLTWLGGEPLVAKKEITELYMRIKKRVKEISGKIEIENTIVTNGFLIDEVTIKTLFELLNIKFVQITIDGIKRSHNKRRTAGETDSYTRILSNIDLILKLRPETKLSVRCNLDKTNINDFHLLYGELKSKYDNKKIDIIPAFVEDYSLKMKKANKDILTKREQGEFILNLYEKYGIQGVNFHPKITTYSCMAKTKNSYAIDPDGYVYKCATLVGQKEFSIFHLSSPEIINDEFIIDFFKKYDYLYDDECLNCSFFPVCDGGCTIQRLKEKYLEKAGEKCPTSKLFLEDFLVNHIKEKYNEVI